MLSGRRQQQLQMRTPSLTGFLLQHTPTPWLSLSRLHKWLHRFLSRLDRVSKSGVPQHLRQPCLHQLHTSGILTCRQLPNTTRLLRCLTCHKPCHSRRRKPTHWPRCVRLLLRHQSFWGQHSILCCLSLLRLAPLGLPLRT